MTSTDPLLRLLERCHDEGVAYVLVGGQAVRLNGFVRATEDIDLLIAPTRENGERIIRALAFLPSSADLDPQWFAPSETAETEKIRVADDLLIDLLFSANGETYDSMQPFVRELVIEETPVRMLDINGLIRTKTDCREIDLLDKRILGRIKSELEGS